MIRIDTPLATSHGGRSTGRSSTSNSRRAVSSRTRPQVPLRPRRPHAVAAKAATAAVARSVKNRRKPRHSIPVVLWALGMVLVTLLFVGVMILIPLLHHHQHQLLRLSFWGPSTLTRSHHDPRLDLYPLPPSVPKVYRSRNQHHNNDRNDTNATTMLFSPPIFVVGLPKAGTSSLFQFFHCHGYWTQHWYCCGHQTQAQKPPPPPPATHHDGITSGTAGSTYMSHCLLQNLAEGLPLLDGCGDYDVYTELNGPRPRQRLFLTKNSTTTTGTAADSTSPSLLSPPRIFLPQHYNLQALYDYAPSATWILNVRPVEEWVESVMKVPAKMLVKQLLLEVKTQDPERWKSYRGTRDFLRAFWDHHMTRIQQFVEFVEKKKEEDHHHHHRLIVVNITNPTAGEDLARDLGWMLSKDKENEGSPTSSTGQKAATKVLSRARACWGAHNVNQHGGG